jgi:flagellar motor switch protein FliN/FliY
MSDLEKKIVPLRIELGRTRLARAEAAKLTEGSVAVLDQHVEDLVDVYVDEVLVARGEMLRLDGKIGVRIVELVGQIPMRAAA